MCSAASILMTIRADPSACFSATARASIWLRRPARPGPRFRFAPLHQPSTATNFASSGRPAATCSTAPSRTRGRAVATLGTTGRGGCSRRAHTSPRVLEALAVGARTRSRSRRFSAPVENEHSVRAVSLEETLQPRHPGPRAISVVSFGAGFNCAQSGWESASTSLLSSFL